MSEQQLQTLQNLICCPECRADLLFKDSVFECENCGSKYPIIDNILRFVPESYWTLGQDNEEITSKTKNYFGFEWDYFKDWGFIQAADVPPELHYSVFGGTVEARKKTFLSKVRLAEHEMGENTITLDAGCGNGRFTYEAGLRSKGLVIGLDIGYGSVKSAYRNTKELPNVIILQGNLFKLPFKNGVLDNAFSNGVLMHTGDARSAFKEIARTIKPGGIFVAHVYNKLNPVWEMNDRLLRLITTRLSIESNLKLARFMATLGMKIESVRGGFRFANYFLRIQSTVHHMFDWYSAPVASHHTFEELLSWFKADGFETSDKKPAETFWNRPWATNIKGRKL